MDEVDPRAPPVAIVQVPFMAGQTIPAVKRDDGSDRRARTTSARPVAAWPASNAAAVPMVPPKERKPPLSLSSDHSLNEDRPSLAIMEGTCFAAEDAPTRVAGLDK